jgi:hypothetical protein
MPLVTEWSRIAGACSSSGLQILSLLLHKVNSAVSRLKAGRLSLPQVVTSWPVPGGATNR